MAVLAGQGSRSVVRRSPAASSDDGLSELGDAPQAQAKAIPKTNKKPLWSLAPAPVVVVVHGRDFEIAPTHAADWLEYLFNDKYPDLYGMITTMLPDIDDFFFDQGLPIKDMYRIALQAMETASARPWWVTLRLIGVVHNSWHILGPQLIFHGVDATVVTLAAWLDCALYLMIEHMEPEGVTMFTMQLEKQPDQLDPFADVVTEDEAVEKDPFSDMEMDSNAFLALAQ